MATVVCNKDCQYRKAAFCGKDFVMLNQFGMCDIWFDKNGRIRMVPAYPAESEPQAATEKKPQDTQLSERKIQTEEKDENNENTEA